MNEIGVDASMYEMPVLHNCRTHCQPRISPRLDRRFHDELTGFVCLAIEFGELNAACVGAGLVFDQQGVPPQVACRGARHLTLQRHLGPGIDNVGRDVNRTRRLTAHLIALRSHVTLSLSYQGSWGTRDAAVRAGLSRDAFRLPVTWFPWRRSCLRCSHGRGLSPGHAGCRRHLTLRQHTGRVWARPACR